MTDLPTPILTRNGRIGDRSLAISFKAWMKRRFGTVSENDGSTKFDVTGTESYGQRSNNAEAELQKGGAVDEVVVDWEQVSLAESQNVDGHTNSGGAAHSEHGSEYEGLWQQMRLWGMIENFFWPKYMELSEETRFIKVCIGHCG